MSDQEKTISKPGMTILQRLSLLAAIGVALTLALHYLR